MTFADKLIKLRKKNGWSQEELAEKMNVSRQAVSKWESAQSVPDVEKLLALGRLFGVTTDYLLKDEIEEEENGEERGYRTVRRISLDEAQAFLEWRISAAKYIAAATFLCILSPIVLITLAIFSEIPQMAISENFAGAVGIAVLILTVAAAVCLFVYCGLKNAPYEFLDGKNEEFETEYGVRETVEEKKRAYRPTYIKFNIIGTCLCVLSPIPLLASSFTENELLIAVTLDVMLVTVGAGVTFFILSGVRMASMQKLLREGEYAPEDKNGRGRKEKIISAVSGVYWLAAAAVFLVWTLMYGVGARQSWITWPVAGILYAAVLIVFNAFFRDGKK